MFLREIKKCENCLIKTRDNYPIPTNKGKLYLCSECYENSIRRESKTYKISKEKNNYEE